MEHQNYFFGKYNLKGELIMKCEMIIDIYRFSVLLVSNAQTFVIVTFEFEMFCGYCLIIVM